MVGQKVELVGAIGNGKLADYVLYQGEPVYFIGPGTTDTGSISVGTRVVARGVLRHNPAPKDADKTPWLAAPTAHYSIDSAQVEVLP